MPYYTARNTFGGVGGASRRADCAAEVGEKGCLRVNS
jgi:hypothetical protein